MPRGYETFFMLNSAKHEMFSANKYENANKLAFSYLLAEKFSCSAMFSKTEFAIISNSRFISRTNFMLSWVEHEKSFMTSGPGHFFIWSYEYFIHFKTVPLNLWSFVQPETWQTEVLPKSASISCSNTRQPIYLGSPNGTWPRKGILE